MDAQGCSVDVKNIYSFRKLTCGIITLSLVRPLGDIMNFVKKNWFAVVVIVALFALLGQIGDGSPPNLQDNLVAAGNHF